MSEEPRFVVRRDRGANSWKDWVVLDRSKNEIVARFPASKMEQARGEARRRNWQASHR